MVNQLGRSLRLVLFIVFLGGCVSSPAPTATSTPLPAPVTGSTGMGDPYYPNWGNGGYDVESYIIKLDVDPIANILKGSTTIEATATERLSSFNLDFHRLAVESINVNEESAEYSRNQDELTIKPSMVLELNEQFTVVVNYNGTPKLVRSTPNDIEMGWSHSDTGAINVWGEPSAASTWFPNNNHPRDKAAYRFEITVPKPWLVAASGTLKETKENGDKTTFIWEMHKPMATYLASINIDKYELFTQSGPHGVGIRDYYPTGYSLANRMQFNILPAAIAFFEKLFGPYPFDEYGVVIADPEGVCSDVDMALEAQSMSIHCPREDMATPPVIVHELAHMWFGDSVSLKNWQDIWLKEGFATYAEWLWDSKNDPGTLKRLANARRAALFDDPNFTVAAPSQDNLYTDESYTGGALVLQALRLEVGDEVFFKILQTYVEKYRYGVAGTDDFITVANETSGRDLKSFFDKWLFSKMMPQLPE